MIEAEGKKSILFMPFAPYETPAVDAICENYNRMADNGNVDIIN